MDAAHAPGLSIRAHGLWHRVLLLLAEGKPESAQYLRHGATGTLELDAAEFHEQALHPLATHGLIRKTSKQQWRITEAGQAALVSANTAAALAGALPALLGVAADPTPLVGAADKPLLTTGRRHTGLSAAERLPPVPREGTAAHSQLPSRMGNNLHFRDGRITDLAGNPVTQGARP